MQSGPLLSLLSYFHNCICMNNVVQYRYFLSQLSLQFYSLWPWACKTVMHASSSMCVVPLILGLIDLFMYINLLTYKAVCRVRDYIPPFNFFLLSSQIVHLYFQRILHAKFSPQEYNDFLFVPVSNSRHSLCVMSWMLKPWMMIIL